MAMMTLQTSKAQTNVANAQKTANNETVQKPVTFNTVSSSTKKVPAVQPQTTGTVNNEAAIKPQQPAASQSVAQGSAKTISTPSANEQNASAEKQTIAQSRLNVSIKKNQLATDTQESNPSTQQVPQITDNGSEYSNVQHYVKSQVKIADINNDQWKNLPNQTFTQHITYTDQTTGKSVQSTSSFGGKKGDVHILCDPVISSGWFVPLNISTDFPSEIYQPDTNISIPVVNPYNAVEGSLADLTKGGFPFESIYAGNTIASTMTSAVAPGGTPCNPIKINFTDPNGKVVECLNIDDINFDDGTWALPVSAPKGYKFINDRENWVGIIDKIGGQTLVYNYPVELISSNTVSSNSNDIPSTSNTSTILENGAGYQVIQKGSSIIVNYNSKQVASYNNVSNLKKNANGLTFNANNNTQSVYLGTPVQVNSDNLLPFNNSETEQSLLNTEKKNSNVVYLGSDNNPFSPLDATRYIDEIIKDGSQYIYYTGGTGWDGRFDNGKTTGVDNSGQASNIISNVNVDSNGDVTFTINGQKKTLSNNWLNASANELVNSPNSNVKGTTSSTNTENQVSDNVNSSNLTDKNNQSNTSNSGNKTSGSSNTTKPTSSTSIRNVNNSDTNINGNKMLDNSTSNSNNTSITGLTNSKTNGVQSPNGSTTASTSKLSKNPIRVTVHYVGQDDKVVGTVVDTIQPGSTLDVSKNVPQGYEVSSAFKPQTGVQADNAQATLNVPIVPVDQNGKVNQANNKGSANNVPNNQADKKNAAQKASDKQKATNSIQAQEKGNQQSLHDNGDRNVGEGAEDRNTSANGNTVPTFNVAGNVSQAASIAQATGNGQSGVQESASSSVVRGNQARSVSTSSSSSSANALPETGMSNEGIVFAATMLALAGTAMNKREHEE